MAAEVLSNVVSEIIKNLGSLAVKELGLWWGVNDELQKLQRTVTTIQAVLVDAEEKSSTNNQVKAWLQMLEDVVYDADDLLDVFSTEALRRQVMTGNKIGKEVRLFFSRSNQLAFGFRMAHRIKEIRGRLEEVKENRGFHLEENLVESRFVMARQREQTHSSLPEILVGRDDDKKAIIELLLCPDFEGNVSIISIVGIGGLGKTTLAQYVYNDAQVRTHFELRLWVCVSNVFDVKVIVENMLESAGVQIGSNLQLDRLQNHLQEKINGKKYLLVLDDVWNEDFIEWSKLKDLLIGGARGSRIMITTRSRKVAEVTQPVKMHELQGLTNPESWDLFARIAFRKGKVVSPSLKSVGEEIVKKCVGVPLAIKTIGGLLYFKEEESEWLSFRERELSKIDQTKNGILPTLQLSYDHLPSHLKHCFAYCRLFPKDWQFTVGNLIDLWMGQGYIKLSDPSQHFEEVGREYFIDLLSRSFFQDVGRDPIGNIETCKMHDLIHDLAVSVAGRKSTILDSKSNMHSIDKDTRHAWIDSYVSSVFEISPSLLNAKKLRTLICECKIEENQCLTIFSYLKCLRSLDFENLGIERVPPSIDKLKHIRYLNLSCNKSIEMLPDSITKLQNLQVLNLSGCERLKQLPRDIKKLINLSHLSIWRCVSLTHMPRGLGQLTSLQKLPLFLLAENKHSGGGLDELRALNNLRRDLEIMNLRYVRNPEFEFEAANLKEKQHLQTLNLVWKLEDFYDNNTDDDEKALSMSISIEELRPHRNLKWLIVFGCGMLKFPSWVSSLSNLVILRIDNCRIGIGQHFPPLNQFPHLKEMEINKLVDLEYIEVGIHNQELSSFFPSLEKLYLSNCPNLKGWRRDTSTKLLQFQCLEYLVIEYCPNLTSMPLIPTVQNLQLKNGSMKSMEEILKIKISVPQSCNSTSSVSASHSQLKTLGINKIEDLEYLPEQLMRNLTSLLQLEIINCRRLESLSDAIPHLTSLEVLIINACEELDLWDDGNQMGMQWQLLKSLGDFLIINISKLVSLPKGLLNIPNLQKFLIRSCPNLMSLPEWMVDFGALEYLYIEEGCPELAKRCGNNKAADWPKIAHIPNIEIEGTWIQLDGCYRL